MKRWKLAYELTDCFDAPVTEHFYSLRCLPRNGYYQKVLRCACSVEPCPEDSRSRDSFGNELLTGHCPVVENIFHVSVEAEVSVTGLPEPELRTYVQLGMYRYATAYTQAGAELEAFAAGVPAPIRTPWRQAAALMDALYHAFSYRSGSTAFRTTAQEAFAQGCGVCQDYAHILLALLRSRHITARYAAGAVPGEGASHAWVEVWQDGHWKGFDPTNNCEVDENYILFAVGRDARDCCLNTGIFRGAAGQKQSVLFEMICMDHNQHG